MEFHYNVNEIFKSPIVEINHTLVPPGYSGDRRALREVVTKVSEMVNAMGEASASAQGLTKPITTADRLRNSEHKLYFLIDNHGNHGKGAITGMLKTGNKSLYVFDRDGIHYQVSPPFLLDFYIHESRQRNGLGKQLFEHMLQKESIEPVQMAIDRPSDKLLGFFNKHYQLKDPVKQMNNYVVYDGFFPTRQPVTQDPYVEEVRNAATFKKNSANGLQAFQAPLGRYGAPRPPCSMGQIIHNQTPTIDQRQEPSGVQSMPGTFYTGTISSPQPNSFETQNIPNNMYYGNQPMQPTNINQFPYQANGQLDPKNQPYYDPSQIQNSYNFQNMPSNVNPVNVSYQASSNNNTAYVGGQLAQMNMPEYQYQQHYVPNNSAAGDFQNMQGVQHYVNNKQPFGNSKVSNGMDLPPPKPEPKLKKSKVPVTDMDQVHGNRLAHPVGYQEPLMSYSQDLTVSQPTSYQHIPLPTSYEHILQPSSYQHIPPEGYPHVSQPAIYSGMAEASLSISGLPQVNQIAPNYAQELTPPAVPYFNQGNNPNHIVVQQNQPASQIQTPCLQHVDQNQSPITQGVEQGGFREHNQQLAPHNVKLINHDQVFSSQQQQETGYEHSQHDAGLENSKQPTTSRTGQVKGSEGPIQNTYHQIQQEAGFGDQIEYPDSQQKIKHENISVQQGIGSGEPRQQAHSHAYQGVDSRYHKHQVPQNNEAESLKEQKHISPNKQHARPKMIVEQPQHSPKDVPSKNEPMLQSNYTSPGHIPTDQYLQNSFVQTPVQNLPLQNVQNPSDLASKNVQDQQYGRDGSNFQNHLNPPLPNVQNQVMPTQHFQNQPSPQQFSNQSVTQNLINPSNIPQINTVQQRFVQPMNPTQQDVPANTQYYQNQMVVNPEHDVHSQSQITKNQPDFNQRNVQNLQSQQVSFQSSPSSQTPTALPPINTVQQRVVQPTNPTQQDVPANTQYYQNQIVVNPEHDVHSQSQITKNQPDFNQQNVQNLQSQQVSFQSSPSSQTPTAPPQVTNTIEGNYSPSNYIQQIKEVTPSLQQKINNVQQNLEDKQNSIRPVHSNQVIQSQSGSSPQHLQNQYSQPTSVFTHENLQKMQPQYLHPQPVSSLQNMYNQNVHLHSHRSQPNVPMQPVTMQAEIPSKNPVQDTKSVRNAPFVNLNQGDHPQIGNSTDRFGNSWRPREEIHQPYRVNQAGDYLQQRNINENKLHSRRVPSAAELYKTNTIARNKRNYNKIINSTECDLSFGYPPQVYESPIFNIPLPTRS